MFNLFLLSVVMVLLVIKNDPTLMAIVVCLEVIRMRDNVQIHGVITRVTNYLHKMIKGEWR